MTVDDFVASAEAAAPIIGRDRACGGRAHQARGRGDAGRPSGRTPISASCCLPRRSPTRPSSRATAILKAGCAILCKGSASTMRAKPIGRSARRNPAGLATHPSTTSPRSRTSRLLEAMRAAETRDRIAWNYAHDFADIFDARPQMAGAGARALGRAVLGRDARLSRLPRASSRHADRAEIRDPHGSRWCAKRRDRSRQASPRASRPRR